MSGGFGNRDFDLAERRVEEERLTSISRAASALEGEGSDHCVDCGADISPARREAMPNADRCVGCQFDHERGWK